MPPRQPPAPPAVWQPAQAAPPLRSGSPPVNSRRPRSTSAGVAVEARRSSPAGSSGPPAAMNASSASISPSEKSWSGIRFLYLAKSAEAVFSPLATSPCEERMKAWSQGRSWRAATPLRSGPTTSPLPTLWQPAHCRLKVAAGSKAAPAAGTMANPRAANAAVRRRNETNDGWETHGPAAMVELLRSDVQQNPPLTSAPRSARAPRILAASRGRQMSNSAFPEDHFYNRWCRSNPIASRYPARHTVLVSTP